MESRKNIKEWPPEEPFYRPQLGKSKRVEMRVRLGEGFVTRLRNYGIMRVRRASWGQNSIWKPQIPCGAYTSNQRSP